MASLAAIIAPLAREAVIRAKRHNTAAEQIDRGRLRLEDGPADGAVADIEREALAAPPGTLVIAGAPRRSWDFALPYALRPPFTNRDLTQQLSVISHSSLHCCPAFLWEPYTRDALRAWVENPARPPVIALYWNPETGKVARRTDKEEPFLRSLMTVFLETDDVDALDRAILDTLDQLVAGRRR